jgi:hypothetical protein
MERGKLRMQRAISRSALVHGQILDIAKRSGRMKPLDQWAETGETEEGGPADAN